MARMEETHDQRLCGSQNYPGGFPPLVRMLTPLQPKVCPVALPQGELEPEPAQQRWVVKTQPVAAQRTCRLGPGLSATADDLYNLRYILPLPGPQFSIHTIRKLNR